MRYLLGGLFFFIHALLEAFDTFSEIAHHLGDAATAEQDEDDDGDDGKLPDTETHGTFFLGYAVSIIGVVGRLYQSVLTGRVAILICVIALLVGIALANELIIGIFDRIEQTRSPQFGNSR